MSAIGSFAHQATQNGVNHRLRGDDPDEFGGLHAAVTADWGPRDVYERRWVHGARDRHVAPGPAARAGAGGARRRCRGEPADRGDRPAPRHLRPLRGRIEKDIRHGTPGSARLSQPVGRLDRTRCTTTHPNPTSRHRARLKPTASGPPNFGHPNWAWRWHPWTCARTNPIPVSSVTSVRALAAERRSRAAFEATSQHRPTEDDPSGNAVGP